MNRIRWPESFAHHGGIASEMAMTGKGFLACQELAHEMSGEQVVKRRIGMDDDLLDLGAAAAQCAGTVIEDQERKCSAIAVLLGRLHPQFARGGRLILKKVAKSQGD